MRTVLLLVGSNLFMTYAWYGHLRTLRSAPLYVAVLASWGVALFEYALQIGYGRFSLRGSAAHNVSPAARPQTVPDKALPSCPRTTTQPLAP